MQANPIEWKETKSPSLLLQTLSRGGVSKVRICKEPASDSHSSSWFAAWKIGLLEPEHSHCGPEVICKTCSECSSLCAGTKWTWSDDRRWTGAITSAKDSSNDHVWYTNTSCLFPLSALEATLHKNHLISIIGSWELRQLWSYYIQLQWPASKSNGAAGIK